MVSIVSINNSCTNWTRSRRTCKSGPSSGFRQWLYSIVKTSGHRHSIRQRTYYRPKAAALPVLPTVPEEGILEPSYPLPPKRGQLPQKYQSTLLDSYQQMGKEKRLPLFLVFLIFEVLMFAVVLWSRKGNQISLS